MTEEGITGVADEIKPEEVNLRRWMPKAAIIALATVAWFIGKDVYNDRKSGISEQKTSLQSLQQLQSLLSESRSIYESQNALAQKLSNMLISKHGSVPEANGYDDLFYKMHNKFTGDESELQRIIRATTMNSQHRVNSEMREWLKNNNAFRKTPQPTPEREQLADQLRNLELHLNQWHDKYDAWIPKDSKRSLVYLADEKRHGIQFPPTLDKKLEAIIRSWR